MSIADLDPAFVDAELGRHNYVVVRDDAFRSSCEAARAEYDDSLQRTSPHPPNEAFRHDWLKGGPWRKLAIGSRNGVGESYAQNLQTTYFQWDSKEYPALASIFASMIAIRNKVTGVRTDFGSDPSRDKFWNACRVHHYPRGGGFMAMHRDTYFPLKLGDKPFYQVGALLSRLGTDFFTGGGVVIDTEGRKVSLEAEGGFGALVIWDGRVSHGVEDIDLDQLIDFSRADGRLAAFAGLYTA